MVKRGGTKRKIAIEKIQKKDSVSVTFTKRRDGLFSKASQLCLLSGAQIAILATPPSSESNVSFYSFGHSSVDNVVSAFLAGQRPLPVLEGNNKQTREDVGVCLTRKDLGLGFWWEDESLNRTENPEELRHAIDSMWTVLKSVKELNNTNVNHDRRDHTHHGFVNDDEDLKNKEKIDVVFDNGGTKDPDQTLILQSSTSSAICCIPDGCLPEKNSEVDHNNNALCESFCVTDNNNNYLPEVSLDYNQEMGIEQTTTSAVCCIADELSVNSNDISEAEDLIRMIHVTDNNNNALPQGDLDYDQEIDIEQLLDFDTPFEISFDDCVFEDTTNHQLIEEASASLMTNSKAVDDDDFSMDTTDSSLCSYFEGLKDEDDLHFSDYFYNLPTIEPLW